MTPKEKYQELFVKFNVPPNYSENIDDSIALDIKATKQCVLIAVDEILDVLNGEEFSRNAIVFWEEVKAKIEKL